jgi:type II secretory pathway pseudopilin PulG
MKRLMKYYKEKKGITLVLIALMLAVLLFFLGMAVDISYMYHVKNQLQVAADAAALAGAANLGGSDTTQPAARQAAWKFACKNRAANQPVYLSTNTPSDCDATPPAAADLNGTNNPNGDIVVGDWNPSRPQTPQDLRFCAYNDACWNASTMSINALKARPRMTGETVPGETGTPPMPKARVFIGQVFRIIGIDWSRMSAVASAIASKPGIPTSGIAICINTCSLTASDSAPISLDVREQTKDSPFGLSWTELNTDSPIGTNSCVNNGSECVLNPSQCGDNANEAVAAIIWGLAPAPNVCGKSITTQNGVATVLDDLGCAFKSVSYDTENKDIVSGVVQKWRVLVPVQEPCPSGKEPGPWPVIKYAQLEIKGVFDTGGLKGIQITKIECIECADLEERFGGPLALVK